jgi:ribosome-associated toxin RatA of RatAB toxin-antitoxin module
MTVIDRSALVGHSAQAMYALVADVESYPQFLPWCDRAAVSPRGPDRTVATLRINFHGLKEEFTTENVDRPGARIDMKLVSGPFRSLEGSWSFTGLGDKGCKVELGLRYEFSSAILEKAIGPVFRNIADSLVEAFVRRAAQKYGRT